MNIEMLSWPRVCFVNTEYNMVHFAYALNIPFISIPVSVINASPF